MNDRVIETRGLGRRFGIVYALDAVDLEIEKDTIVSLLGPNGAGKTTLMRLLMGLLAPSSGEARIFDVPCRSLTDEHTRRIGYMGDSSAPPGWASIGQLIDLKASVCSQFDHAAMNGFMAKHRLNPERAYGALSKGQKKWVQAGILLAACPDLILMDEPAEGLDPLARRALYDHLRDYVTDHQATALVTTHVIGDIERVADDVAIINRGQLALHASLEDLREQVREIKLPGSETIPEPLEAMEILRQQSTDTGHLLWVRCTNGVTDLQQYAWFARAKIRSVSLETLYFAITTPDGPLGETP
jgi:ABC-2 type transport system ATP-binding protein